MSDLVERLNEEGLGFGIGPALLCQEAAAEITRLRAALTARDERMKAEGALEAQAKIARLTEAAIFLWGLLDDIDTLDDACRTDDNDFRIRARNSQKRRFEVGTTDGYSVTLTALQQE